MLKSVFINAKYYLGSLIIFVLTSCDNSSINKNEKRKVIAEVYNSPLFEDDLKHIIPKGLSKSDSLIFIQKVINSWAYNEVFYKQALNYLSAEELNIDKEVEEYKKTLLSYKFETKLLKEKLDTIITNSEIEEYYNKNSQNFLLKNNIVKVLYVKTPINIPNLDKLKKLCYSSNPKDQEQLKSLCIQYANNFYMNDDTWLMFDDLKKEIHQLKEVPEYNLQNGKIFEFNDSKNFYFLKIIEVKSKNTLSPLNFEIKNIKNIILYQRKQKLITTIKKDFFELAKTNKDLKNIN